jgi:hypothetical protein
MKRLIEEKIHLYDSYDISIIYDVASTDLTILEHNLLKTATMYINSISRPEEKLPFYTEDFTRKTSGSNKKGTPLIFRMIISISYYISSWL